MAKNKEDAKERDYKATIMGSSRELSVKEKIMFKDLTDTVRLDTVVSLEQSLTIDVDTIVELAIHNENARDDKDYETIVIVAKDGTRYSTSSESVRNAIEDIMEEAQDGGLTEYNIKVLAKPSKNREGQHYLTATIA